jgi:ribosome-associated translation inhibitor RaiA
MQTPIQLTFRQMDSSPAVAAVIRKAVERLERLHPGILGCQVTIDAPHRHQLQGRHFQVHIRLTVPGGAVVASRAPTLDAGHEDIHVAIRDAFRAARRELTELARRPRGDGAAHPA